MNLNTKIKDVELADSLNHYIIKRLARVEKFIKDKDIIVHVDVQKTTAHHKHGDVFRAEILIGSGEGKFFAAAETDDAFKAVDMAKEEIIRKLISAKDREQTLFKRGALSVKKMMKGLTKRNPVTSKY